MTSDVTGIVVQIMVKSQVLAGGMAWELLKMVLRVVYTLLRLTMLQILLVYLCQKLALVNEMYFSIILDRKSAGPLVIACSKGGTSIEDLA
nr:succinate--CoA ligase [ADP-forming] subunit beta, mitochondrial-like [Arachis hypogaea]